jgi:hypothetical protein
MIKFIKRFGLGILLSSCMAGTASAGLINVALDGTAAQSSTGFGGVASRAIDGNTNGVYWDGSVTHTQQEVEAWWEVDLGSEFKLFDIVVWNRTDCCADRLNPFLLELFDSAHQVLTSFEWSDTPNPSKAFSASGNHDVQFIRITLAGDGAEYLQLAEVQAFANVPEPGSLALLGLGLAGLGLSRRKARS